MDEPKYVKGAKATFTVKAVSKLTAKAEYLDRLVDFIIRDYLRTCDEADRDFGRHATTVFQFASNYVNDTIMHIDGEEIPARSNEPMP